MRNNMRILRLPALLFLVFLIIVVVAASQAARFLVVEGPVKSDAIVVLAGETDARPARGVELLRQGLAPHVCF